MSTMRVLVFEDDANLRSVLRAAMERKGCEIEEACDGAEALSQIGGKALDAAIVDYHLPPPTAWKFCASYARRSRAACACSCPGRSICRW